MINLIMYVDIQRKMSLDMRIPGLQTVQLQFDEYIHLPMALLGAGYQAWQHGQECLETALKKYWLGFDFRWHYNK